MSRRKWPGFDVFKDGEGVPTVVTDVDNLGLTKDLIESSSRISSGEQVTIVPRAGSSSSQKYTKA
jgi:hypothetical protein